MKNFLFHILIVSGIFYPYTGSATAEDDETHWYTGYSLVLGGSAKQFTFTVMEKETDIKQGALTEDMQYSTAIIVDSPVYKLNLFPKQNLKWLIEYYYSTFSVSKQIRGPDLDGLQQDMGTSVSGEYLHITPIVFVDVLDDMPNNHYRQSLKLGFGVGLSYVRADGDIFLTEISPIERKPIHINEAGLSFAVLFDYRIDDFMFRTKGIFPTTTDGDTEFEVYELSIDVGYIIIF